MTKGNTSSYSSTTNRALSVIRVDTTDNIFGCQAIVYTATIPNDIRMVFFRVVVNADYSIGSQLFYNSPLNLFCNDVRAVSD